MRYKLVLRRSTHERILTWRLRDELLVDVLLRLRDDTLLERPTSVLRRVSAPFEGLVYEFSLVDPWNRLLEHLFVFRIVYGQDEETLIVAHAAYLPQFLA